jgi:hypothetical protein
LMVCGLHSTCSSRKKLIIYIRDNNTYKKHLNLNKIVYI